MSEYQVDEYVLSDGTQRKGQFFVWSGDLGIKIEEPKVKGYFIFYIASPENFKSYSTKNGLHVDARNAKLIGTPITTLEYPGFPTDTQPLLTTLMSLATGDSLITEKIYENRFMHVPELNRMGAHIQQIDNKMVLVHGVKELSGAIVTSSDLRGGVALVLAGLAAQGETIVQRIYHIDRGYDHIEDKLSVLGADIIRFKQ